MHSILIYLDVRFVEILVVGFICLFTSQIFDVGRVLKHNHNCHFRSEVSSFASVSAYQVFQSEECQSLSEIQSCKHQGCKALLILIGILWTFIGQTGYKSFARCTILKGFYHLKSKRAILHILKDNIHLKIQQTMWYLLWHKIQGRSSTISSTTS